MSGCARGPMAAALRRGDEAAARERLGFLREVFGEDLFLEVWDHAIPDEAALAAALLRLARREGVPWCVTGNVHYATPAGRRVHDVLTCLRHRTTLDRGGRLLRQGDGWHLRSPREVAETFGRMGLSEGVRRTLEVAARCTFRLEDLRPTFPTFPPPDGHTCDSFLEHLVWEGARTRYPAGVRTPAHDRQIRHELDVIRKLGLAGYFLVVWDIVRFARERGILVQGRGSAANSAVCYCLGITAVDPIGMDLLFERFLSEERAGYPDIDLDIAHDFREEVLQYVFERYGRDHAAMVCETITFQGRSAVRDVARVLGFSPQQAAALAEGLDRCQAGQAADLLGKGGGLVDAGFDPADPRVAALVELVRALDGLPRHRSIHVGGFVLTAEPLDEVVPIEPAAMAGRTILQWDKDDLPLVGLIKVDLLGLGMLTLLQEAIGLVRRHRGVEVDLAHLPQEPGIYAMIRQADVVGVFQIESRAQMSVLPRIRPECFYDLVVQVGIIRPGPIQGDMVHPYIRRRQGKEEVTYLHPDLEPVLRRTLGVPLFQEQGMKVAIVLAGFTPAQADRLRRVMSSWRSHEEMAAILAELRARMTERGVAPDVQERVVRQIGAFASYGFPESHAASFALLVYASAYLKYHYPVEFYAALLNAQPMGFYTPATVVADARRHGVEVRGPDVARSAWDCTVEDGALCIGLRYVRDLGPAARRDIEAARRRRPFNGIEDFVRRTALPLEALRSLAMAGAFRSFCPDRRQALWEVLSAVRGSAGPLDVVKPPAAAGPGGRAGPLRPLAPVETTAADFATTGMSPDSHPMEHLRDLVRRQGALPAVVLRRSVRPGPAIAAGVVIARQRPVTAKGFCFMTLEDETGTVDVIVRPDLYEREHRTVTLSTALIVEGTLQREGSSVSLLARRVRPLAPGRSGADAVRSRDFR